MHSSLAGHSQSDINDTLLLIKGVQNWKSENAR